MSGRRLRRIVGRFVSVLAVAYAVFLCAMFVVMRQPPQRFGRIMRHFPMPAMMIMPFEPMWNIARGGTLKVGDIAPDFTLPRADHSGDERLSSYRGRPVVLVFGSYT